MDSLALSIQGPWLIGGDFNSILYASEKQGGAAGQSKVCGLFRQWFDGHQIFDLKFKGPRFTSSRGFLFKRLDRALCNNEWLLKFADNSVLHLPKVASDHRPVLVWFERVVRRHHGNRPYRFLASWLTNDHFNNIVKQTWDPQASYSDAASIFVKEVQVWNREVFGNIFQRKRILMARINEIQAALEKSSSRGLMRLEARLRKDLEIVMGHDEIRGGIELKPSKTIRSQWAVVEPSFCKFIADIFNSGKRGLMAIKVDLEKPYDQLNWSFIFDTLQLTGIPIQLSKLIIECVTTSKMSILWNEEAIEEFSPGRGIRKGDPLSPYIFVLCIERLSHEASINQAYIIDAVLENYCRSSEAKFNKSKTKVFFSKNVLSRDAQLIGDALGFSATKDLGCYLGMPLIHSRSNFGSIGGSSNAHLCNANNFALHKIDTACRRFIWDRKSKRHKMSMVGWDIICMPRNHGGLGFKKLDVMNHALLMKLTWEVVSNSDKLWVKVFCSKYGLDPGNLPLSLPDKQGSRIWMTIRKTWADTMHGARWSVCDGVRTWFWLDCWVTKQEPLINFALQPISHEIINAIVSEFLNEHGGWNWLRFEHLLPNYILMQIASVMPPASQLGIDKICWSFDPRGVFTVRSTYDSICRQNLAIQDEAWSLAWSWKGPQSIHLFLWQIMHGKLKTHGELSRCHIPVSMACDRCGASIEDILYALRDCHCIKQVWLRLVPEGDYHSLFHVNLRDWIVANLQNKLKFVSHIPWECVFGVAVWRLWLWRNHFMVEGKLVDSSAINMDIMARANEIHRVNNSHMSQQPRRKEMLIGWQPPPWPWYKLNTDGSVRNSWDAGAGGVIRDSVGLILAWDTGIKRLLVEVDSLCVSHMISKQVVVPNAFYALVVAIRKLLSRNWQVSLTHIFREANSAADFKANMAHSVPHGLHLLTSPPVGIYSIILQDMFGVAQPRIVPV
ncbi:putative ribonuclease H protein [Citrus sinensis]|uniref:Ribonuclease H protein n=1 Tax=Citrus sinensis TaxID=2711 RepID=A0ACB8JXJ4_CITSI|nr:putative ribonuclease H protein [Citrus sinensis]